MPRDGSLALPKDVEVKPLSLKGSLNTTLNVLVLILARGSNGFPGGHADLNRSFPSLKQDSFQGVLVVEVLATSFRSEVVQQEAPEDVQGLSDVGVPARVITVKVRGVVILFEHGLAKEDQGP